MKHQDIRQIQLRQLDDRLSLYAKARGAMPKPGWIRTIRKAIGMTTAQLAGRLGITQSAASKLEKSEQEGSITIASLNKVAGAMNCDLVYVFVPREGTLEAAVRKKAERVAEEELRSVAHSMALEAQSVSAKELRYARQRLVEKLLAQGSWSRLWRT